MRDDSVSLATVDSPAPLPRWKKFLLICALGLGLSGVVLYLVTDAKPATPPQTTAAPQGSNTFQAQSFMPSTPLVGETQELKNMADDLLHIRDWSAFLMKLGFSFVVGFSIGYAAAGFLRLTVFILGSIFLLLFALQYIGLIHVNWGGMEGFYDSFILWLKPHIGSFKDFITGNMSSSVLASAGLWMGFKR
jgi:uncharacterized membrane protein (Fun14 family)